MQISPAKSQPGARENLWAKAIHRFWSDPANLIGPPGALVRRSFKLLWMALSIYILIWVAAPLQIASWQLWMTDDVLAARVGWSFTLASALGFAIVRYAADATDPIKMPIFLPTLKGWRDWRTAHLHLPIPTVAIGAVMVGALFGISLLGLWNLYLHDQQTTGGASVAAITGSTDRVGEAQRALNQFEVQTAAALAIVDQGIRETSAGSPTGRSRLVRQRTELMQGAAQTRRELQAELRTARAETVVTHQTFSDPRPVDAQVAGATGWGRPVTASVLDLLRSAVVEMLLVMGAALGLVGSTSRIGVPVGTVETIGGAETVAATASAPPDEPPPPVKRRYTLPAATAEDHERAATIGPVAWAPPVAEPMPPESPEPASGDPEPIVDVSQNDVPDEGGPEFQEEIDPLVAEHLSQPEMERDNV
jgi:hypothetical protein